MLIGNNVYKLIYLDTNVLRAVIDNENGCGKGFFTKFVLEQNDGIPCFSFANVCEIRPYKDIYERLLNFFSVMPCLMFYHYRVLVQEEYKAYQENRTMVLNANVMRAFIPDGKDKGYNFSWFIEHIDNQLADLLNGEKSGLADVVTEQEKKRQEFKKLGITDEKSLGKIFLAFEKPTIIKDLEVENISLSNQSDYIRFPSLRMLEFSLFQRAHLTKRPLTINDVMDIRMSGFVPYVGCDNN